MRVDQSNAILGLLRQIQAEKASGAASQPQEIKKPDPESKGSPDLLKLLDGKGTRLDIRA
ncbi:MAG: hypothetical protein JST40_14250 [Armatimonadetes bacterium]|nr:hypothetical protein [Armatimonadota bacterium]